MYTSPSLTVTPCITSTITKVTPLLNGSGRTETCTEYVDGRKVKEVQTKLDTVVVTDSTTIFPSGRIITKVTTEHLDSAEWSETFIEEDSYGRVYTRTELYTYPR